MGSPFGLKGFVKVRPFSGECGHFFRLDKAILRQGEKEEAWDVAEIVPQGDSRNAGLLMRFEGIDTPEAARLLQGAEIIVPRKYAAPLKEGEYYVEDLKGLEVIGPGGEALGHIVNMLEGGGGDLAEIEIPSGERRLVPFRNEFFGDVDLETGKIALNEPWILE